MAFSLGSVTGNVDVGGLASSMLTMTIWLVLIVVVAGVAFLALQILKYDVKITIFERIGNTARVKRERGKIFKTKEGVKKLRLLKSKLELMPPEHEHYFIEKGKKALFLYEGAPNTMTPISLSVDSDRGIFESVHQDVQFWAQVALREGAQEFDERTWWDKYGNYAVFFGGITITFLMVLIALKYTADISEAGNLAARELGASLDKLQGGMLGARPPG